MVPPPGLVLGRVAVASERSAEGAVRLRNGHMARDCWRRDSMAIEDRIDMKAKTSKNEQKERMN